MMVKASAQIGRKIFCAKSAGVTLSSSEVACHCHILSEQWDLYQCLVKASIVGQLDFMMSFAPLSI